MRFTLAILASAFLLSCVGGESRRVELAKEKGMEAVKELHETLRSNLKKAMKEKGPEGAIDFCSTKAEELTKSVSERVGLRIKRTSLKFRNEKDRPDALDEEVLKELENRYRKSGKLPEFVIRKTRIGGKDYYVFYKPITVKKPCLKCHGDVSKMDPKILETLKKHYPNDRAVNYREGDFRGAIRVDIPADKLK